MIHTRVDREDGVVWQECDGDVHLYDVLAAMITAFDNPSFDRSMPVLWNFQQANILVTAHEINNLPREIVDLANENRPSGKTAWVTRTAFGEATIRLLYDRYNWATVWRTFATLESAVDWCKRDDDQANPAAHK